MVELLETAFREAQALSAEMQEELAHVLLAFIGNDDVILLTAEEDADLADAEAEVARGEIATDEEVAAVFGKYRR